MRAGRRFRRPDRRSAYEQERSRLATEAGARLGQAVDRLSWPRERVDEFRRDRLRSLLARAATRPHHRERLGGLDPASVELDDLPRIAPTDKSEMMSRFDEVVTDPEVNLADATAHLDRIASGTPSMYLGRHHVVASGGTSGHRAIVVWDTDGWIEQYLLLVRRRRWYARHAPDLAPPRGRRVNVRSAMAAHISAANAACFELGTDGRSASVDAALPLGELVAELERLDPGELYSSPPFFEEIARLQRDGTLALRLAHIYSTGNLLTPATRRLVTETFDCGLTNEYGITETGMIAGEVGARPPLLLDLDAAIVEVVDADDRPVPDGHVGDHLLVTNLINHVQPIIRYRIDDRARIVPTPDAPLTADGLELVGARHVDPYVFGDREVDFGCFEDVLLGRGDSHGWQVYRTERGLGVDVVGAPETEAIRLGILEQLERRHVTGVEVVVRRVERLTPHPTSGKTLNYLPHVVDWIG